MRFLTNAEYPTRILPVAQTFSLCTRVTQTKSLRYEKSLIPSSRYIYVNGELQDSEDAVGQPWDSFEAVYIGADEGCNNGKGRCHWSGIIDEIVIFNVPLAEGQ